jgi:hypothetical protein
MIKSDNLSILLMFFLLSTLFISSCGITRRGSHEDTIPVLSQDELIRPYTKLGRIQVTRETFGADYLLTPDIKAWGLTAVRQEAEKMGADAITLPEVTVHSTTNGIIPSTEYRATGFAIKFK